MKKKCDRKLNNANAVSSSFDAYDNEFTKTENHFITVRWG